MEISSNTAHTCGIRFQRQNAFSMAEMLVVLVLLSLMLLLAQANVFTMLKRNSFRSQVQLLISTMQSAINAASQSERRYEFIVDLTEQSFLLREITTSDLAEVLEEEILINQYLSDKCTVVSVEFDDGDYTFDGKAKFRAGHAGWAYGGKIVLQDEYDQKYSIVVNRMDRIVVFRKGDYKIIKPVPKDELST